MNKFSLTTILFYLALSGCSSNNYVPMTQELRLQEKLTASELKSLQYFICPGINIHFHEMIDDSQVNKGVLIQRNGSRDIRLEVEDWSPAVGLHATDHLVAVSLERGLAIPFGVDQGAESGAYQVLGRQNGRDFEVFYNGNWYRLQQGEPVECNDQLYYFPQIWVDTQALEEIIDERRALKGRFVEEYPDQENRGLRP